MPVIKLQSSDGEVFDVDVKIANQSGLIKNILMDLGVDGRDEEAIPLPKVNAATLKQVIRWATHHQDDPPISGDDENKLKWDDWDGVFLAEVGAMSLSCH